MDRAIKSALILALIISMFIPFELICYANAAEPPSILIIVSNPPSDLEISIKSGDGYVNASTVNKASERYYIFYSRHLRGVKDYAFKITTGGESYHIAIEKPLKSYHNVYTLSLKDWTLTPGKLLVRSFILISLRLVSTLLIEAVIFWLFGLGSKRYWMAFLVINLITQGILNIWINGFIPTQSYLIYSLIFGEILVLVAELCAFLYIIKPHRLRTALYVVIANLASLIAGGYLITELPI